jgi:hypothetical protein
MAKIGAQWRNGAGGGEATGYRKLARRNDNQRRGVAAMADSMAAQLA